MKNFLGKGLAFPIRPDGRGRIEWAANARGIADSVRLILGTAPGERVMRPDFGCAIHDLVFHPVSPNTCAAVTMYVVQSLRKWEFRITDLRVDSYPDPNAENTILIAIEYKVIETNHVNNLVYPFYLRREQDL